MTRTPTTVVKVIDLDVSEHDELERVVAEARQAGGYLHVEIRVVKPGPVTTEPNERRVQS